MTRESSKRALATYQELNEDLQQLLSHIRARENSLVFFLYHFNNGQVIAGRPYYYIVYKSEFLQRQNFYNCRIAILIDKSLLVTCPTSNKSISGTISLVGKSNCDTGLFRTFWIRLKSIVKVSMERMRALGLLDYGLFDRYELIITLINYAYDVELGFKEYSRIYQQLKKRTIEALISGKKNIEKQYHHQSDYIEDKNSLKIIFKQDNATNYSLSPLHANIGQYKITNKSRSLSRYNRVRKLTHTHERSRKTKISDKVQRKFEQNINQCEKNMIGVVEGKIYCSLDRRKSILENVCSLCDMLFQRNIGNHKEIIKHIFAGNKMIQQVLSDRRYRYSDSMHRNNSKAARKSKYYAEYYAITKYDYYNRKGDLMRKRPKLIRPNTYKHLRKVIVNKTQAMRCAYFDNEQL